MDLYLRMHLDPRKLIFIIVGIPYRHAEHGRVENGKDQIIHKITCVHNCSQTCTVYTIRQTEHQYAEKVAMTT